MSNKTIELASLARLASAKNRGDVDLLSLATLPAGVRFENGGYVYLPSLASEYQSYRGGTIRLRLVDSYTMLLERSRPAEGGVLHRARYFGGGDIDKLKPCWIAERDGHYAHGETPRAAFSDLDFKIRAENLDVDGLVETVARRGRIERKEFRLLTGACEEGLRAGLKALGLDPDLEEMPLADAVRLSADRYGGDRMAELFGEGVAQ